MTRGAKIAWASVGALVAAASAATFFVVIDDRAGRFAALSATAGFFGLALMTAISFRALTNGRLRIRRTYLPLLVVQSVINLVFAFTSFRSVTSIAFLRYGDRTGTSGTVVSAMKKLGEALGPDTEAPMPAPPPSASASASASPIASAPPVDPEEDAGIDSGYTEPECELTDVSAVEAAHDSAKPRATLEALATVRYPMGLAFIKAQDESALTAWLTGAPETFAGVASRFDTVVHEGSHIWRSKRFDGRREVFPVRGDLTIETKRLATFHRSEILSVHVDRAADSYASTYLEGASGAQGFQTLLDEYQAYTHSLASRYCIRDLLPASQRTSARDGILTMMYYVETYLALAREKHPKDYFAILGDPGHRKMILTVWERAEFWLRKSKGQRALGISDAKIATWVYEPSRLAEIQKVRDADQ